MEKLETKNIKHILVVCHDIVMSGGLKRFERFGNEITKSGHNLSFLVLSSNPNPIWECKFDCISLEEACVNKWDVTMVPGAGFPEETINKFALLTEPRFGVRMQHILNDQSIKNYFMEVNKLFKPDIIIFNNRNWEPGSFTSFEARKFIILEGAVDIFDFVPLKNRVIPSNKDNIYIGALANKNPAPLLEALNKLPDRFKLIMIGELYPAFDNLDSYADTSRLEYRGLVNDNDLKKFYNDVDCIVHTELFAGWANMAAEALACGVPLICSQHGTKAFAIDNDTALILKKVTASEIIDKLVSLFNSHEDIQRLTTNGRKIILKYSWQEYSSKLMDLCIYDANNYYTFAPKIGLYGKWPLSLRLKELDYLLNNVKGKTVIDLGSAEGVIALEIMNNGAECVHGFEFDKTRVELARTLCEKHSNTVFKQANLSDWQEFIIRYSDILLKSYDIVLYLGLHHHLSKQDRVNTLLGAASLVNEIFVIRTPGDIFEEDEIASVLNDCGLEEYKQKDPFQVQCSENLGKLKIYKRS